MHHYWEDKMVHTMDNHSEIYFGDIFYQLPIVLQIIYQDKFKTMHTKNLVLDVNNFTNNN